MQNNIKEICQGYWKTYDIIFKGISYLVKIENDDFNNWELTITDKAGIEVDDDIKEEIELYLEEEKVL